MSLITLNEITQAQYDAAEKIIIDKVRAAYPDLDLRAGTVLREQLIRPAAELYALDAERMNSIAAASSLAALEASANPDPAAVNAILSNFNMTLSSGTVASGILMIKVNADRVYSIPAGFTFTTITGLSYTNPTLVTAKTGASTVTGELPLYTTDGLTYYFLLPVTAVAAGESYNIAKGTALNTSTNIYGYISATAYVDFTGGFSGGTVQEAVANIPAALSHRSMTDRTAITARLHDYFDPTDIRIRAVSVQGYGDAAQLRDKHNVMGFAVGSRVDCWVRTFDQPSTVVLIKEGTQTAANTYTISIGADEAPGYYAVKAVSETDSLALGSYAVVDTVERTTPATSNHDISVDAGSVDSVGTIYQVNTLTVSGVDDTAATRQFKVELYVAPGLGSIQAYMDDLSVCSLTGDYLARCPRICFVECSGTIYRKSGTVMSVDDLVTKITDYINSRSFVRRLTRSELANILLDAGASRIDLSTKGFILKGTVRDALGNQVTLSGDELDLDSVENADALLTTETTVFAAVPSAINLTIITE